MSLLLRKLRQATLPARKTIRKTKKSKKRRKNKKRKRKKRDEKKNKRKKNNRRKKKVHLASRILNKIVFKTIYE
jgi:F0F1-type ATP synthase epsilon subunit